MIDLKNSVSHLNVSVYLLNDGTIGLGKRKYQALKDMVFWKYNRVDLMLNRVYRDWRNRQDD
jgi:hypothetical protein